MYTSELSNENYLCLVVAQPIRHGVMLRISVSLETGISISVELL